MQLEPDIIERIRADFPPQDVDRALALMLDARGGARVARCVVFAAKGSLEHLEQHVRSAIRDYRDAIVAGEYEPGGGFDAPPVRNFRVSFLIDSPEKMWIGYVADVMHARGYVLSCVEARTVAPGPVEYQEDRYEGVARFNGPLGTFELERRDRRWTICGDIDARRWEHVVRPYEDEQAFCDVVSGFLLASLRDRK